MDGEKKVYFSVRLPPSLLDRAKALATREDRSTNYIITRWIKEGLDRDEE